MSEDLLWGKNPVIEAIKAGRPISRLYLQEGMKETYKAEILKYCRQRHIPYNFVDKKQLSFMSGNGPHQGIVAQTAPKAYVPWEEMLAAAESGHETPLLVILDAVEDPQNLGAVLRCADAMGAHGVVIPKNRAAPLTSGVAKAAAGAVEYMPVDRVTNLSQTMERMKTRGLWIGGADMQGGAPLGRQDLKGPLAIVFGGEDKGLSRLVKEQCDFLVSIPMRGRVNSLNVAAAASIVLYEAMRQRTMG
jgi:23S rRNA (guanosine2251-2'-O)-methyltransferase